MTIDQSLAEKFAALALAHVRREYPNKLDHVMNGPDDVRSPRELHPIFYGSFDWHSNVHGYWLLATLLREVPELSQAHAIRALFNEQFTDAKVAAEVAYLKQPNRGGFERPYGWAWLLMLFAELRRHDESDIGWSLAMDPLRQAFSDAMASYVERLTYPIRTGTHFNTSFAVALCLEYTVDCEDYALGGAIRERASHWFSFDRDCQAWEPSGDDFLSSALMEAECMRRVLPLDAWRQWFNDFLPHIERGEPKTLFEPAIVSDRTDGKIAHLDGLNLSRAWCWRSLASALPEDDARRATMFAAADRHLDASLPYVAGDYAGEHWLATFALLALSSPSGYDPTAANRSPSPPR